MPILFIATNGNYICQCSYLLFLSWPVRSIAVIGLHSPGSPPLYVLHSSLPRPLILYKAMYSVGPSSLHLDPSPFSLFFPIATSFRLIKPCAPNVPAPQQWPPPFNLTVGYVEQKRILRVMAACFENVEKSRIHVVLPSRFADSLLSSFSRFMYQDGCLI